MAAAGGIGGLIEVAMKEHGCECLLSSGGASVYTYSVNVHIRIFLAGGLNPCNSVWESGVFKVFVTYFLKLSASEGSGHGIELDDDKSNLREVRKVP